MSSNLGGTCLRHSPSFRAQGTNGSYLLSFGLATDIDAILKPGTGSRPHENYGEVFLTGGGGAKRKFDARGLKRGEVGAPLAGDDVEPAREWRVGLSVEPGAVFGEFCRELRRELLGAREGFLHRVDPGAAAPHTIVQVRAG